MDTEPELISIILPTYNRAHLLPRAINSVLAQTYQNWELLIWDDGSSDETFTVISSFIDPRIKYFTEKNHGKSYALNRCLEISQGEMVAFLDDDDQWLPQKLEVQEEAMMRWPEIDLLFTNFFNSNVELGTKEVGFEQSAKGLAKLKTQRIAENWWLISQGFLQGITCDNFMAPSSVMIRKKAIEHVGYFNEQLRIEDFEYLWRFGLSDLKAAYTEQIFLNRIKYPGSLSSHNLIALDNHIKALDYCAKHSKSVRREDTLIYLKPAYRNAWQNKIQLFGTLGEKGNAWKAFIKSLRYGIVPGSVKLILQSLILPNEITIN